MMFNNIPGFYPLEPSCDNQKYISRYCKMSGGVVVVVVKYTPPPLRTSDLGGKEKMLSGRTNRERDPE